MQENTVIDDYLSSESDDQLSSERSSEYLNHLKVLLMFLTMWQFAFKISNSAITALLRFMRYFILSIGRAFSCDAIMDIAHSVPLTLSSVHKLISLENDHFVNFVVRSVTQYMNFRIVSIWTIMACSKQRIVHTLIFQTTHKLHTETPVVQSY